MSPKTILSIIFFADFKCLRLTDFLKKREKQTQKMSTKVDFEIDRDKEGFLKCEDCQRRFLTKFGFKIHSYNQHKKVADTQPNEHQQLQTKMPRVQETFWTQRKSSKTQALFTKKLTPQEYQIITTLIILIFSNLQTKKVSNGKIG